MRGRMMLILFAGLLVAGTNSGCALESTRKYLMMNNRVDGTEEAGDDWSNVGKEGRGHLPIEKEQDAWFDNWFHSKKFRDIEHNLGVD